MGLSKIKDVWFQKLSNLIILLVVTKYNKNLYKLPIIHIVNTGPILKGIKGITIY